MPLGVALAAGLVAPCLALAGCTRVVEVLTPAGRDADGGADAGHATGRDAGSAGRDAGGHTGGAGMDAGRAGAGGMVDAGPQTEPDAGACLVCPDGQVCALDRCVSPIGPSVLDAGFEHGCYLWQGGLYCWGDNRVGQLGQGDLQPRNRPTRVGSAADWVDVCAGERHTCAVRAGGELLCWGDNGRGQLGVGDNDPRLAPQPVMGLDAARVACGGEHSCALDQAGVMYCWGSSLEGQLGLDDPHDAPDVLSAQPVAGGHHWRTMSLGQGHSCAIDDEGGLWCWGRAADGQLGVGSDVPLHLRVPTRVTGTWDGVAAGQHHTCGIRADGTLWCWGLDQFGELGIDVPAGTGPQHHDPVQVGAATGWRAVAASWFHTCATRGDAELRCWGRGIEGQLGLGDDQDRYVPAVVGPSGWRRVSTGLFHSCAERQDGSLWCWGANGAGQLGVGDDMRRYSPVAQTLP